MSLCILGNGAIGNLLSLKLWQQQHPFVLLTRNGRPMTLRLTKLNGESLSIEPEVRPVTNPSNISCLVLPLKAYQILPALQQVAPHIQDDTSILLLHNGMGTIEQVVQCYPANQIIAATTSYAAYKPNPFHCIESGQGETHAGVVNQGTNNSAHFCSLLDALLPPCHWHQNIQLALWHKLAINAAINPLTALNQIANGRLQETCYQQQINLICEEVAAVMTACGYPATASGLLEKVNIVIHNTARNFSSMCQDVRHRRRTEIEFITGYVVAQGLKHGVEVSYNQYLQEKMTALYE